MRERIIFVLLAGFAVVLLLFTLVAHLKDGSSSSDLMGFYTAGTLLKRGLRSQVYDENAQLALQKSLFGRTVPVDVYDHPPFETLIYWALAYLPYSTAYVLWDLLNLVMLGWSLYLLKPYATHFDTGSRLTLTLAILCPLIATLREGQNQIVLLLTCVGAFVCLKKRREFAAGGLLGAGLFRFQFVVPFLLVFLALKRWRIIFGAASAAALLAVVSLALVGWAGIRDYVELLLTLSKGGAFPTLVPAMPNVRGFVDILLAGRVAQRYMIALVVAGSLALLAWPVIMWRWRNWDPGETAFDLLFSLSMVVCVMINYHSLIHSLIVLVLPALLFLDYTAAAHPKGFERWRPMLPLNLLFLMTVFLNVEGENRFSFLFVPILWFASVISGEIPPARPQAAAATRSSVGPVDAARDIGVHAAE